MTNTGLVHQHVGSRSENEERQAEERWYNTIGPLCNTALGRTQDTTLIDAAFQSDFNCETPKLVVHTVGQDSSVVLFANSIYREVMTQHPLRVGLPLSATFPTVPQQMLEEFYWWLCAKVQGCLMKWEAHEGVVGKGSEEFVIEHPHPPDLGAAAGQRERQPLPHPPPSARVGGGGQRLSAWGKTLDQSSRGHVVLHS